MTRHVQLVDTSIDIESLKHLVDDDDVGSHGWFYGVTRRTTSKDKGDAQITASLSYEAHRPMALKELTDLADRALQQFELAHLVIVHRLGEVPIGEASVVVGCSSAHRPATFAALAWIMDTLKREVPIWKRELFADGSTEWVHPTQQAGEDA